jgi:hypothetical protein
LNHPGDNRHWPDHGYHGHWQNGDWHGHYQNYHNDWLVSAWRWNRLPWFWTGGGGWWGMPYAGFNYYNPYVVAAPGFIPGPIDYSLPLPAPIAPPVTAPIAAEGVTEPLDPNAPAAMALFDAGRVAFRSGDYATALRNVDEAIQILPSDAAFHEFRALTLFALQRYPEAAAALYSVLAVGPGWTWDTVSGLYGDPAVYTNQLRALEAYVARNPTQPAGPFLLAYQYLVIGNQREAAKQYLEVMRLSPQDKISAELYKALTTTDS